MLSTKVAVYLLVFVYTVITCCDISSHRRSQDFLCGRGGARGERGHSMVALN